MPLPWAASQGFADVGGYPGRPIRGDTPLGAENLGQAPALDVTGDHEVGPFLAAPVQRGHDVGVRQSSRHA